jgi:hypothetical protein
MAKSNKGVNALKKINREAKRLARQPKNKGKKYSTLRKEAASKYKAGKLKGISISGKKKKGHLYSSNLTIGRAKKKRRVGAAGSQNKSHKDGIDRKKVDITIGRVSSAKLKGRLVARLEEQLAWALLMKDQAKTAKAHHLAVARISKYRHELNALKG